MLQVDIIIAGGGPAGCAAAAAFAAQGRSVLVVDAGLDRKRQLAGELLHPSGVEDLRALGFGAVLDVSAGQAIEGFAVVDQGPAHSRLADLPYPAGERGLAMEHAALAEPLLSALDTLERVTVRRRTRVVALPHNAEGGVQVTLDATAPGPHRRETVCARVLVAADGRASPTRKLLGIAETHDRLSTMVGMKVDRALLPHPERGHLFIGGPAPVLAYAISARTARVMVDLPAGSRAERLETEPRLLDGVPDGLRAGILAAIREGALLHASNDTRVPAAITAGSAVLIGDAAGCCHPLSASGISSGVRDARELAAALEKEPRDVSLALKLYARRRRPPQRTRIALATALYKAFAGEAPEMEALKLGLFEYWRGSASGARVSMSLLSTREGRMWVMAREYARVVGRGTASMAAAAMGPQGRGLGVLARAGTGLLASALPHLSTAIKGSVEDLEAVLGVPALHGVWHRAQQAPGPRGQHR